MAANVNRPDESPTPDRRRLAAVLVIPVVVALLLTLFAWPQARLEPRELPIGLAGPAAETAEIEARLAEDGDAFDVHQYADEAAAREASVKPLRAERAQSRLALDVLPESLSQLLYSDDA